MLAASLGHKKIFLTVKLQKRKHGRQTLFTLLKLRQLNVFSPQSFHSFLTLDFSVSRSAATSLWLSFCKILCLSFLRGFSIENKFLFDFLMYFAAIVKDLQFYKQIQLKEFAEFPFPKWRANNSKECTDKPKGGVHHYGLLMCMLVGAQNMNSKVSSRQQQKFWMWCVFPTW